MSSIVSVRFMSCKTCAGSLGRWNELELRTLIGSGSRSGWRYQIAPSVPISVSDVLWRNVCQIRPLVGRTAGSIQFNTEKKMAEVRGQIIAKSGQSGEVGSPQLHFEIRKGSSPVDPLQFLNGA
jgi:hypothetical protein